MIVEEQISGAQRMEGAGKTNLGREGRHSPLEAAKRARAFDSRPTLIAMISQ